MISIVVVYNDRRALDEILLKSLRDQTSKYELIAVENTERKFESAAEALNYGGKQANGEYIAFVHQDVELDSATWLQRVERILDGILDLGIAGVAGMSEKGENDKERGRGCISDCGEIWQYSYPVQCPEEVQTLDECLLIVPRPVFSKMQFDEITFDGWHCYGVDYCLRVRQMGLKAYVVPAFVYHRSLRLNVKDLQRYQERLCDKHGGSYKHIFTTCGEISRLGLSEVESEKQRLQSETSIIRSSLCYRFMRFYASNIDRMFPDGTRRGEFRKIVTASLHIIADQGLRSFSRQAMEKIRRREFRILKPPTPLPSTLDPYLQWLERDRITERVLTLMKSHIELFSVKPKFSILMSVFNPPVKFLRDAIDSVLAQVYSTYELCICDNGSNAEVKALLRSYEKADSRIKICTNPTNLGISKGLNEAFKMATGEFIGLLDHDDVLDRAALYYVARTLNDNPQLDVIYTDRDHMDENGVRCDPYFKPDWSPHRILSHNYVVHFLVFRTSLLKDVGGFRKEFDGSQDYDLILRLSEKTKYIAHIPRVLYSWRRHRGSSSVTPRMIAYENAQKAISEALHRRGAEATVTRDTPTGAYRVSHKIKGKPLVSIIISSFDVKPYLDKCISSIVDKSIYSNYEIIVATNNPNPSSLKDFCSKNNVRLVPCGESSFYSEMNNQAANSAKGDFLVFLNDDILVETPSWVEEMLQLCQLPEVGAVGPMQIRPDSCIQYTSSVSQLDMEGKFYHFSPHAYFQTPRLFGFSSNVISDVSSLSGSCMMIKRQLFMSLGGFDSDDFALSWQDMDLCYKLLDLGLYNIYTPYAVLIDLGAGSKRFWPDYDSVTGVLERDLEIARKFLKKYHKRLLAGDPFFNKNLCGSQAFVSPRPFPTYEEVRHRLSLQEGQTRS